MTLAFRGQRHRLYWITWTKSRRRAQRIKMVQERGNSVSAYLLLHRCVAWRCWFDATVEIIQRLRYSLTIIKQLTGWWIPHTRASFVHYHDAQCPQHLLNALEYSYNIISFLLQHRSLRLKSSAYPVISEISSITV